MFSVDRVQCAETHIIHHPRKGLVDNIQYFMVQVTRDTTNCTSAQPSDRDQICVYTFGANVSCLFYTLLLVVIRNVTFSLNLTTSSREM